MKVFPGQGEDMVIAYEVCQERVDEVVEEDCAMKLGRGAS